jgi:choline dehydrogenase
MAALAWYLPPSQKHEEGHDHGDDDGGDDGADGGVSVCLSVCLSVCQAPGVDMDDDEQVDAFVRAEAHSAYHPCCTAAMGSVVDEAGLVNGVAGLRVVDASVMPSMVSERARARMSSTAEKGVGHGEPTDMGAGRGQLTRGRGGALQVSGNLNAPTIMLAERLADVIKGEQLQPAEAEVDGQPLWFEHPHWQTAQR